MDASCTGAPWRGKPSYGPPVIDPPLSADAAAGRDLPAGTSRPVGETADAVHLRDDAGEKRDVVSDERDVAANLRDHDGDQAWVRVDRPR